MSPPLDVTGCRFGRYTALHLVANKPRRWLCRCDCGQQRTVPQSSLRSGKQTSCGCRRADTCTKHGHNRKLVKSPTWTSWTAMLSRCRNPNNASFACYGARGIRVCERWAVFENFLRDMGERPAGTSLDRIDSDGNYEPQNCRWATPKQQQANTRKTVRIALDGEVVSLIEASRRLGVHREAIKRRVAEHGDPRRPHCTERRAA